MFAYRRELQVHCYRMLGSFEDAEDAVQETFLRVWRHADGLESVGNVRAWLYKIATNVCLDVIKATKRRPSAVESFRDVPWLEPYPDLLLDRVADAEQPDHAAVGRETIALAFLAVMQLLPPGQRAALVLRDVLGWPALEVAEVLEVSRAAVNSLLQRGRATVRTQLPTGSREDWTSPEITGTERAVLARYVAAHESGDLAATLELIADDIRITMPPAPYLYQGRAGVEKLVARAAAFGQWRLVPVGANRQPAAACYVRLPGEDVFSAFKVDVLDVVDGRIAAITTFGVKHFPAFDLPPSCRSPQPHPRERHSHDREPGARRRVPGDRRPLHRARQGRVRRPTWARPSPVAEWTARDVVRHLVEWFPGFLSGAGIALPQGPDVDDDPLAAWTTMSDGVQALLDDPATQAKMLSNPHIGEVALPEAISRFFTADVFMHTWDLARATGQDETLDPQRCAALLDGMQPLDDVLRASGQYGPEGRGARRRRRADEADRVHRPGSQSATSRVIGSQPDSAGRTRVSTTARRQVASSPPRADGRASRAAVARFQ